MRLPFEFTYPWALPALAGLLLVWWAARGAIALVTPKRRRLSWVLRCLVAVCIGLALTDLQDRADLIAVGGTADVYTSFDLQHIAPDLRDGFLER